MRKRVRGRDVNVNRRKRKHVHMHYREIQSVVYTAVAGGLAGLEVCCGRTFVAIHTYVASGEDCTACFTQHCSVQQNNYESIDKTCFFTEIRIESNIVFVFKQIILAFASKFVCFVYDAVINAT